MHRVKSIEAPLQRFGVGCFLAVIQENGDNSQYGIELNGNGICYQIYNDQTGKLEKGLIQLFGQQLLGQFRQIWR